MDAHVIRLACHPANVLSQKKHIHAAGSMQEVGMRMLDKHPLALSPGPEPRIDTRTPFTVELRIDENMPGSEDREQSDSNSNHNTCHLGF